MRITKPIAAARNSSRGFTLMELMVAMAAGLLIAIAAFSFSRQATLAFARESRVASAQMSVLAGFQRLQADVARASYMASPNFNRDASTGRLCGYGDWPAWLRNLSLTGLRVTPQGSQGALKTVALGDGKYPDTIRIVGNLATTESYTVMSIMQGAGVGHDIYIRVNDGPSTRSGFAGATGGEFSNVFLPGRLVRVLDMQGRQHYSVVATANWNNGQPFITTAWRLPLKGEITSGAATMALCGIDGFGKESQVNIVNIVDYGIANLSGAAIPQYTNTIYHADATAPGDDTRTELVRREVFIGNSAPVQFHLDGTAVVAAEYAIDLRAALWTSNRSTGGCTVASQGLAFCDFSSAGIPTLMNVGAWGTYTLGMPVTGPESVRTIRLRLAARSREVDRSVGLDPTTSGYSPPLLHGATFRHQVGTLGFARARTLMADVALMNQRGDAWY